MTVFSLTRNFLNGPTNVLDGANNMTTLMLSSNYFECTVVGLDGASNLGIGLFKLPEATAITEVGASIQ